jgi:protein-S-isoprenylcysteine O-methyltransferase Ste14
VPDASISSAASPYGGVTRLCKRAVPASLFALMSALAARGLIESAARLGDLLGEAWLMNVLMLAHGALIVTFSSVVTVLFLIRRRPTTTRVSFFDMCTALVGSYIMWIAVLQPTTTTDSRVLACSDLLMIGGLAFTIYALLALRACFGVAPDARGLVTSGPYRWVRHPVYLGEFVTALGSLVPVLSPITVLVLAVFCLAQGRRMLVEEAVFGGAFPEYRAYRHRTPAILPLRGNS